MTPRHVSALVILALALSASGCAASSDDSNSDSDTAAIVGGAGATTNLASVGQLYVEQVYADGRHGGENYCTATVVGPDTVLTTARCLSFQRWVWQSGAFDVKVFFGVADDHFRAVEAGVSEVIVPKGLEGATESDKLDGSIAVVHLRQNLSGIVPLTWNVAPKEGAKVTAWGFGCDGGSGEAGTLRSRELSWREWEGWFGTTFTCSTAGGHVGAAILDSSGKLVGLATTGSNVIAFDDDMKAAIDHAL
jgi:V8-like Glu-specific endopeptidase